MKVDESISSSTQFPQRLLQRKRGIYGLNDRFYTFNKLKEFPWHDWKSLIRINSIIMKFITFRLTLA